VEGGRVVGGGRRVVGGGSRLAIDWLAASTGYASGRVRHGYALGGKGTAIPRSNLTMRQQHDMTWVRVRGRG
jgi:hypothetical protein